MNKGYFIVCEGMDAAGKTTSIHNAITEYRRIYGDTITYNKGLKSDSFFGKISEKFPSTITLLVEQLYQNNRIIKPELSIDNIVIQDRWYYTVLSHNKRKEKLLEKIFTPFLSKPDALVYFSVSLEERLKRLNQDSKKAEHMEILNNPKFIKKREERMLKYYSEFDGPKIIIDTTSKTKEQSGHELYEFICSLSKTFK
jgi:thymidylate kinase